MSTHAHVHTHTFTCIHKYTHAQTCTHTHSCTHAHMHKHKHTHVHACTHTLTHMQMSFLLCYPRSQTPRGAPFPHTRRLQTPPRDQVHKGDPQGSRRKEPSHTPPSASFPRALPQATLSLRCPFSSQLAASWPCRPPLHTPLPSSRFLLPRRAPSSSSHVYTRCRSPASHWIPGLGGLFLILY